MALSIFCTPSSIGTRDFQPSSALIRLVSAKVQSGSPGRLGICTVAGALSSFAVIRPRADELDIINAIYLELVASAATSEAQADRLRTIATNMMARERLDAIVLAGTELALIGDWHELKPRILSSADLHVAEIVRRAVAGEE